MSRLFVYGSLRSDAERTRAEARRAFSLLESGADCEGPASLPGRLHAPSSYPAFVPSRDARVRGEVWRIASADLLPALDRYEGDVYAREARRPLLDDGRRVTAWIYRYRGDLAGVPVIASGDYLQWLEQDR